METVSSVEMHPATYPNQMFHSKAAAVASTAALPVRVHVTGQRNVKALQQAFLEMARKPVLMQTSKCFFKTLMRTWRADIHTWEGFQDQQSPSSPPVSSQYFISTNLCTVTQGWLEKKKVFLQPHSAFSLPRKILKAKFCTFELHYAILCLWITYYYYIQNRDHLLCSFIPIQNRTELDL